MNPVSVIGATRRFGSFVAVDDVDLEVAAGEVVGLVGANGAGKTTLIRMILGLLAPSSGRITVFGQTQTREQRRRVGYVPQNLGLYRDLTAGENLEFRARIFGSATDKADFGDGLVRDLPLGTQRRAAFIAATQHDPELLILDEPTSGVSPLARTVLWDLIRRRAEGGAAVLVSTHYMDEAEQADRIVLMSRGRVVAQGSVDDIVAGSRVTEVVAAEWGRALQVLEADGRMVTLSGRTIRVLADTPERVNRVLLEAGVDARVTTAPATLDETIVVLES
ncbi:MAG: ABC transporter ATP-binding protein [Acidimicrobiia bacterium]|nr:ABC transporter ATP-binding protein [Acidimicrobiia bacterium]